MAQVNDLLEEMRCLYHIIKDDIDNATNTSQSLIEDFANKFLELDKRATLNHELPDDWKCRKCED